MRNFLVTAAVLIVFGPAVRSEIGLHPAILPFVGIACALVGLVRHAPVLPQRAGAPSPQAASEAKLLSGYTLADLHQRQVVFGGRLAE